MTDVPSLRWRLAAGSMVWMTAALLATAVLLVLLFRSHIERRFDQSLQDHLEELVAAAEIDRDGSIKLTWEPADPRFKPPLSGWYWQMRAGDENLHASPSLGGILLTVTSPGVGAPATYQYAQGPANERLRAIVQDIVLPDRNQPFTVVVAGPCANIHQDVTSFTGILALSLGLLGLSLGALMVFQINFGLRPLAKVQADLQKVRHGTTEALSEAGSPVEIVPLIAEINALLRQRQTMTERARTEAGDLAHALKTPIAVISNEATQIAGESGAVLKAEIGRMRQVLEHHLVRARANAGFLVPHVSAALDDVLNDIRFSVERLYPDKSLTIESSSQLHFAGNADDLGEMIGNLADNAGKWSRSRIVVKACLAGQRLAVTVEDDGPGLDEAERVMATERGERLDTKQPGHGLGLSIVAQLATLYDGRLTLSLSELGGLRASLDLPASV
jgi:signal transduction histidine kinase